ncbi:TNT domain-containing protein [Streptomyces sp. ID05-26A]|nr:TNT domain-containing protein [Streptomyces sp. ID05-26A]
MSDVDHGSTDAERGRRYEELVQQIGIALLEAAPQGWVRLDLVATLASSVQDFGLRVLLDNGTAAPMEPPAEAADAFVALRELMYLPGRGAWFSARFMMSPPSEYHMYYNFQNDPVWDPPVPDEVLRKDLERFPRPEDKVPNWVRRRLGMPDLPPNTEPAGVGSMRDLERGVADLLLMHAPTDWTQLRVGYREAGSFVEMLGEVEGLDGRFRPWNPPAAAADEWASMRARMIAPGRGTGPWSGTQMIIEFPIRTSARYITEDPGWKTTPPMPAVLDDLRRFPRKPEYVPDWMRAIVPDVEQVLGARARFREARVFDFREPNGRPVVNRPPVPADEVAGVLRYLNEAHLVLGGRGHDTDLFVPDSAPDVPAGFHTDGTWLWPASIPHYLAKHGVPPEAELVDHIRAANFTPPPVDSATAALAHTALTGEVPAALTGEVPVAPAPADLSDGDRKQLAQIALALSEAGINPRAYSLDGPVDESWCLERAGDEWQVAQYERGRTFAARRFPTLFEAGAYLLGTLTILPARLRAGGADTNTVAALNDWPIQPLPGEPPLTLLTHKRMATLMAGREVLRHGGPGGNLVFTPNTAFPEMSLRAEREAEGSRRYRVTRDLRVLAGTTVPWHGQPGGGRGYLLPRSVGEHLADGSLADITGGE